MAEISTYEIRNLAGNENNRPRFQKYHIPRIYFTIIFQPVDSCLPLTSLAASGLLWNIKPNHFIESKNKILKTPSYTYKSTLREHICILSMLKTKHAQFMLPFLPLSLNSESVLHISSRMTLLLFLESQHNYADKSSSTNTIFNLLWQAFINMEAQKCNSVCAIQAVTVHKYVVLLQNQINCVKTILFTYLFFLTAGCYTMFHLVA